MLVRDVMTRDVVTIASDTPIAEAERIMAVHKFERLPIVDEGALVGIITKDDLLRASPSPATTFSRGELLFHLMRMTVKEIMKTNIVTVSPSMTVEHATALAQKNRVGCLVVTEGKHVVGIMTTNDIFYKVVNPLFGIGEGGKRIIVYGAGDAKEMQKVLERIYEVGSSVKTIWILRDSQGDRKDLVLHLDADDISSVISALVRIGLSVNEREFGT